MSSSKPGKTSASHEGIEIWDYVLRSFRFNCFKWVLNSTNWFIITKSIIEYYFPYLFLFLSITQIDLSEKEQGRLIKLCYFLIFLQIPVGLIQYFGGDYSGADMISGTIADSDETGGTGINAVLGGFLFSVCMSRIVTRGRTLGYVVLSLLTFVRRLLEEPNSIHFDGRSECRPDFLIDLGRGWSRWEKIAGLIVLIFIFAVFTYGIFNYLLPKSRFGIFRLRYIYRSRSDDGL
jgi:hypothetical protein